ncbi:MAG TPA: hypothetical protein VK803_05135, partial [Steroidobacteraceae bacterium]|nr:hypothetical protein [Steroidobacteraceae bacterium]
MPEEIRAGWDHHKQGAAAEAAWRELFARYASAYPAEARELERRMRGELPEGWRAAAAQALEPLSKQT